MRIAVDLFKLPGYYSFNITTPIAGTKLDYQFFNNSLSTIENNENTTTNSTEMLLYIIGITGVALVILIVSNETNSLVYFNDHSGSGLVHQTVNIIMICTVYST